MYRHSAQTFCINTLLFTAAHSHER